jgi:hypothetical protein
MYYHYKLTQNSLEPSWFGWLGKSAIHAKNMHVDQGVNGQTLQLKQLWYYYYLGGGFGTCLSNN